jgi:aerobic-type carbon monoxide dehydrogenase small subunit (CoxS/CutS family)
VSLATRLGESGGEGRAFTFHVDGEAVLAYPGETIGAALLAAGWRGLRRTSRRGDSRGLYCVMGVCWECVVRVEGRSVRACVAMASPGLIVETPGAPSERRA